MLKPIFIEARDLPDAWFQTVYKCIEVGREFIIDEGSYSGQKRLEFDYITIHVRHPETFPLLPQLPTQYNIPNPCSDDYLNEYIPYLMTSSVQPNEAYTYGQRIIEASIEDNRFVSDLRIGSIIKNDDEIWDNRNIIKGLFIGSQFVNQMELLIWTYKNKGNRNNQMCLQVAQPTDMLLQDPPCLRHIDTRIQDGKLHFFPYFRSWDLWGGFPANLAALELMKQYVSLAIGVGNGEMIASSKGLHLYDYCFKLAEIIRGKTIKQFKEGK